MILYFLFTQFSYQVFLQEMRFLSLLYWLERFYVPIGITKLLSLWSCFSFDELILPSLVLFVNTFSCIFRFISVLFWCFALYFCVFLLIIVIIQNIRSCNKKGSFLQKSKWVFKKGFLQDVRHNLWEILSGWGYYSGLRQPNSGKIYRKVGRADCGNVFLNTF